MLYECRAVTGETDNHHHGKLRNYCISELFTSSLQVSQPIWRPPDSRMIRGCSGTTLLHPLISHEQYHHGDPPDRNAYHRDTHQRKGHMQRIHMQHRTCGARLSCELFKSIERLLSYRAFAPQARSHSVSSSSYSSSTPRARPKSQMARSQFALTKRLDGFMSRCNTLALWMNLSPLSTWPTRVVPTVFE